MKYLIWRDINDEWRWTLKARNGKTIASGEAYKNRKDCLKCVNSIRKSSEAEISIEK